MHLFIHNCFFFLLLVQAFPAANCCIEHEREALLKFKSSLTDLSSRFASWNDDKCCNWTGIRCSTQTGHVVKLDLHNPDHEWNDHSLSGKINPILLFLSDLKHLDLSYNNFSGNRFPEFISSFTKLKYLNLSTTGLSGLIPPHLGNLSRLQYLDLSYMPETFVSNMRWLSHLSSLKYLDMSEVYFHESQEWLRAIEMLPHLHTLMLEENGMSTIPTSINLANFSSLEVLHIQGNCFNTTMPNWIWKLPNLKELRLLECCFVGPISNQLDNLTSLEILDFEDELSVGPMPPLHNLKNLTQLFIANVDTGENIRDVISKFANDTLYKLTDLSLVNMSLTGNLIGWLSKVPNLSNLVLSSNNLNGSIPVDIGNLSHLKTLRLRQNFFTGDITENHFAGLSQLTGLSFSQNYITFAVGRDWKPPFHLEIVFLGDCKLGPHFPSWLQNQSQIMSIGLSNTGIVDTIPDWFWNIPSLTVVNLSENNIRGRLPNLNHLTQLYTLDLHNNSFDGGIPSLPNSLEFVDLSKNNLDGSIEDLTCGLGSVSILNIAQNKLSGNLPFCWPNTLVVVDMAHNKLSGAIPSTIGNSNSLRVLQLNNNSLTGNLPSTMKLCRDLIVLDIGENKLSGQIPEWIGKGLQNLEVLRLRANMLSGEIPMQIMHLTKLRILDLANNHISGQVPHNLEFLEAMSVSTSNNMASSSLTYGVYGGVYNIYYAIYYTLSSLVVTKDVERSYTTNLLLFKSIDLSGNNLTGEMPDGIITLRGLINLNLSNNHLHGQIPTQIGNMQSIESLDLSMNELSGTIPQSMTSLNFLSILNLSYNNLSGKIPVGNQLQTLNDPYIYIGNDYLCGLPLNRSCDTSETSSRYQPLSYYAVDEVLLYSFLFVGFVLGFWAVWGPLLFKANWRFCFFQMVDYWLDKLCVFIMMCKAPQESDGICVLEHSEGEKPQDTSRCDTTYRFAAHSYHL